MIISINATVCAATDHGGNWLCKIAGSDQSRRGQRGKERSSEQGKHEIMGGWQKRRFIRRWQSDDACGYGYLESVKMATALDDLFPQLSLRYWRDAMIEADASGIYAEVFAALACYDAAEALENADIERLRWGARSPRSGRIRRFFSERPVRSPGVPGSRCMLCAKSCSIREVSAASCRTVGPSLRCRQAGEGETPADWGWVLRLARIVRECRLADPAGSPLFVSGEPCPRSPVRLTCDYVCCSPDSTGGSTVLRRRVESSVASACLATGRSNKELRPRSRCGS
jgi:hypothetical protein